MPCPPKSTAIVSRDVSCRSGFHGEVDGRADGAVDAAYAPGPCAAGRRATSEVTVLAGAADPPGGQAPRAEPREGRMVRWPSVTPACHSGNRAGSVA